MSGASTTARVMIAAVDATKTRRPRARPKPTRSQFRAALKYWDQENSSALMWQSEWRARRALFAAWWFIENVTADDPARTDLFFRVRELVREAGQ